MPLYIDTKADSLQELFARHDLAKEMGGEVFDIPNIGDRFGWRFERPLSQEEQVALGVGEFDFVVCGSARCHVDGCWFMRVHAALHLRDCGWHFQEAAEYVRSLPEIEYPFAT